MPTSEEKPTKLATLAVQAGKLSGASPRSDGTPIYQSSTFSLTDEVYAAMQENRARDELVYTRYDNPSVRAVEMKLAALEGADDALAFSSGMGAISSVLECFLKAGDRLVIGRDLYGGTLTLAQTRLKELGIDVEFVATEDTAAWKSALQTSAKLVYCESVTNPLLKLADLKAIHEFAQEAGAITVVDNTFASPVNLRPIEFGFDLVIHSGSKYLGGHSDLICGAVSGRGDLIQQVWNRRTIGGTCLDPHAAFLLERGMKTLVIRMERQCHNAARIATFLDSHPAVSWVSYPGLSSHPQYALAARQLDKPGGMVTFALKSDEEAINFMRASQTFNETTSLGGVESVVSMPMNTSQCLMTEPERFSIGITPGTIRMSCGIEHADDLLADIEQTLK